MAVSRILLPVLVLVGVCASPTREQVSIFQTAELIATQGYPSETHHVTTSDGYILEMHRIPHGRNGSPSTDKPVVFMMHGLTAASNSFIILGPEHALAYNLADAGFDIWMGNARGNRNSRFHVSLNPDDSADKRDFFNFSFEEIGIIDIPAMIDYVLEYTGNEKLHYIGHSQGGTTFMTMASMRPEYNEKITSAHLLAGVGYMNYFPDPQLGPLATFTDVIYNTAVLTGFVELFPPSADAVPIESRADYCTGDVNASYMCELTGMRQFMTRNAYSDPQFDPMEGYEPAGAALKQVAHYGQNIRDKSFRRWSYGSVRNLIVYGTRNPPIYDLSLITINVTMHYSLNDNMLDERDAIAMANDMPNTSVRKVARDSFLHEDYVAAFDAKELVNDYIIEVLRRDSGILLPSVETEEAESDKPNGNNDSNGNLDNNLIIDILDGGSNSAYRLGLNNVLSIFFMILSFSIVNLL